MVNIFLARPNLEGILFSRMLTNGGRSTAVDKFSGGAFVSPLDNEAYSINLSTPMMPLIQLSLIFRDSSFVIRNRKKEEEEKEKFILTLDLLLRKTERESTELSSEHKKFINFITFSNDSA